MKRAPPCMRADRASSLYRQEPRHPRRRKLIAAALVWPALVSTGSVIAQPKKKPALIGWLHLGSPDSDSFQLDALKEGLAALGYKEALHFSIEAQWGYSRRDRMYELAQRVAAASPVVIVAAFSDAIRAAVKAAPATPVVMVGGDPVQAGLVKSLARPASMVTGVSNVVSEIREKYAELLLAAVPNIKSIGVLHAQLATSPSFKRSSLAVQRSAERHSARIQFEAALNADEIEPAIARLAKSGAQALVLFPSGLFTVESARIARAALAHRLPLVGTGTLARYSPGALLTCSSESPAMFRRAASYVDRILKGAKPGDLPIEQPTTFELVVNLKTAKALGIVIPQSFLVQATRVIE